MRETDFSPTFGRAVAAQDAIFSAFAQKEAGVAEKPSDVLLSAPFRILATAQANIDIAREPAKKPGVGEKIDLRA